MKIDDIEEEHDNENFFMYKWRKVSCTTDVLDMRPHPADTYVTYQSSVERIRKLDNFKQA